MSEPDRVPLPGQFESRAFFAALLAACRGDDAKAGEILRSLADKMEAEFTAKKGVVKPGR